MADVKQKQVTGYLVAIWLITDFVLRKTGWYMDYIVFKCYVVLAPCILSGFLINEIVREWRGGSRKVAIGLRALSVVLLLTIACVYILNI